MNAIVPGKWARSISFCLHWCLFIFCSTHCIWTVYTIVNFYVLDVNNFSQFLLLFAARLSRLRYSPLPALFKNNRMPGLRYLLTATLVDKLIGSLSGGGDHANTKLASSRWLQQNSNRILEWDGRGCYHIHSCDVKKQSHQFSFPWCFSMFLDIREVWRTWLWSPTYLSFSSI